MIHKSLIRCVFFCVPLVLACGSANAWFFIWLPDSVTGPIVDAITGSEGTNCVGPYAKVGDIIRLPDGSMGTIKSLSGTSTRCTNTEHPIRALVEISNTSVATGSAPINTKVGIILPDGWESRLLSNALRAQGYLFYAGNPNTNTVMALVVRKREGIKDLAAFVTKKRVEVTNSLKDTQESEVMSLTINGLPAWRFYRTGMVSDGQRYSYLHTFLDAGSEYIWLNAWTPAAAFQEQRPAMEKLAYGLTGFTPSDSVAAVPTPPTPTAQPPANTMIDFNSEARKSARILGCITSDLKVVGAEEKNVVFLASCEGGASLTLSCDPTGLCLRK